MSESIIVECRNLDFINNATLTDVQAPRLNGDWETIVQDKVIVEDGDNIILKNAFIDTKATTSDKIVIPDIALKFSFMRYVMNWTGARNTTTGTPPTGISCDDVNSSIQPINKTPDVVIANNDAELYVSCSKSTLANSDLRYVHSIQFINPVGPFVQPDSFPFIFVFVDKTGATIQKPVTLATFNGNTTLILDATYDSGKTPVGMPQPPVDPDTGNVFSNPQRCGIFGAKSDGVTPDYKPSLGFGGALTFEKVGAFNYDGGSNPFSGGGTFAPPGMKIKFVVIPDPINQAGIIPVGNVEEYKPKVDSRTIRIAGGNYDPEELCQTINRAVNSNDNISGDYNPSATPINQQNPTGDNTLLIEVGGIGDKNSDINNFVKLESNTGSVALEDNNLYGFNYNNNASQNVDEPGLNFVGTNQVALGFDKNTQQFFFEYLHMPLYSGGNEMVTYAGLLNNFPNGVNNVNPPNPAVQNVVGLHKVTKNSGVLWTNLEAFRVVDGVQTNESFDFWAGQLGFDLNRYLADSAGRATTTPNPNCLLVTTRQLQAIAGKNLQVCGVDAMIPVCQSPLKDGVNMGGGFFGLYNAVNASTSLFMNPQPIKTANQASGANLQTAEITDTQPIYSTNSILGLTTKTTFGYFLVEVNSHFNNELITIDNTKDNVVAIVSRYYEADSFTSAGSEASVVYTHKGAPLLLSSFKCRILTPEKILAKNIGPDNTIFLEVVKNNLNKKK